MQGRRVYHTRYFEPGKPAGIEAPIRAKSPLRFKYYPRLFAFSGCSKLPHIFYGGSGDRWNQIYLHNEYDPLLNTAIHYNNGALGDGMSRQHDHRGAGWNGAVNLLTGTACVPKDGAGGGYAYCQLKDLGRKLNFNVAWSYGRGIYIETDKPYSGA